MADRNQVKNIIPGIFERMEYGKNFENLDKLKVWVKSKQNAIFAYVEKSSENPNGVPIDLINVVDNETLSTIYVPEIDVVKTIISKSGEQPNDWFRINPIDRAKKLKRLAEEIEINADLFAQIEVATRGILSKATKTIQVPYAAQLFNYYSGFGLKNQLENPEWKPQGISAAIVANETPLSHLALFLAPALAAGYNIVLQVGTKLSLSAYLILELALKVGIPENTLRLIPSDDGELLPYLGSEKLSILSLFLNLQDDKYRGINTLNKKILHLSSHETPIIVFDGADLDSAVTGIIELAWSQKSAWPANTVLLQENIFSSTVEKLKEKLKSLKVGPAHDKTADIPYRSVDYATKLEKAIASAKNQGIEVFQAEDAGNKWYPTLFIGGLVETNNVLKPGQELTCSALNVLAFRTIDEAVNLANNTKQGIGATIWSENIGIINEVSQKLKVANIWVNNSSGVSSANVQFTPIKESGSGWFGGSEGFYEYVQIPKDSAPVQSPDKDIPIKVNSSILAKINAGKKAQESWNKMGYATRGKLLQQFAENINDNNIINVIFQTTTNTYESGFAAIQNGYSLSSFRNPKGIVALYKASNELLITALYNGNAILLLEDNPSNLSKELSQKLPAGVLTLVPNTSDVVKTIASHNGIGSAIGLSNALAGIVSLNDSINFVQATENSNDIVRKVTVTKNVWYDIGKSTTFNL